MKMMYSISLFNFLENTVLNLVDDNFFYKSRILILKTFLKIFKEPFVQLQMFK